MKAHSEGLDVGSVDDVDLDARYKGEIEAKDDGHN